MAIKLANPVCMDCGLAHPPHRLQFDHRPGDTKIKEISWLVSHAYSMKTLQAEIAKCDLVCANCHADRTYARMVAADGFEPSCLPL
jgi:hypothetical protein